MAGKRKLPEVGAKYGEWAFVEEVKTGRWVCRCSCGVVREVSATHLRRGASTSCGHGRAEVLRQSRLKHGLSDCNSRIYSAWKNAKQRCYAPNNKKYERYGGRGIKMHPEWVSDFAAFAAYVGEPPGPEYSLGRIDNDKDYEPGNVEWQTDIVQANNRSSNHLITYQGITLTLTEWCSKLNLSRGAVTLRINRRGWSAEKALSTPIRKLTKQRKQDDTDTQ